MVIPHKLGALSSLHSQGKWNNKSTDTESNASSCSGKYYNADLLSKSFFIIIVVLLQYRHGHQELVH